MIRLAVAAILVLSSSIHAEEAVDIGSLLKKPCDEEKKKPEATPTPQPKVEAIPGLLPADKKPAEPAKKSLGALPEAMENCK